MLQFCPDFVNKSSGFEEVVIGRIAYKPLLPRHRGLAPPPPWNCFKLGRFHFSWRIGSLIRWGRTCWLVASITAAFGLASQAALADNECGPVPSSGGTIVCNTESYDPASDGNIVYRLGSQTTPEPNDYTIEFRGLKGEKGIVINSGDAPHNYFPARPNGVWIEHWGPGNLAALVSGIKLTTTEADAGTAAARGFNLTLYVDSANTSTTRRDLSLEVENSIFNTYARALTGVHVGTGDVNIEATDLQITTTGQSGHGIVGWHDANGNVNVNVKRSNIVASGPRSYGVSGFVWNSIKFNQIPDPGDKTLSLQVSDSQIRAHHGLYARHQGSGKIDLLLSNSSITTESTNGYGIFAYHSVNSTTPDAPDNLDVSINIDNSQVTTANAHGILVFRQLNPNSTGTDRITVGPNSKVEVGGTGAVGIFTQSVSDITVEGQVISKAVKQSRWAAWPALTQIRSGQAPIPGSRLEVAGLAYSLKEKATSWPRAVVPPGSRQIRRPVRTGKWSVGRCMPATVFRLLKTSRQV